MNTQLIARLRNGEIVAKNNGTLEQLKLVLAEAFPNDEREPSGQWEYYGKYKLGWSPFPIHGMHLPTVPITDFFTPYNHNRAVELLREAKLQIEYLHQKCVVTGKQNSLLSEIEQFLNELNKDK